MMDIGFFSWVLALRFGTQAPGFEPGFSTMHVTCLFMVVE
jgi:hypothetical protein